MDSSSCELVEIFENQDQYFLWISEIDDYSMSLSLQITNGEKVWKGLISISDKPKSREQELNDRFFEMLKKAILFVDYHSYEYSFIHKSHQLQFLIKEKMDGMSALLVKCTLVASKNEAADIRGIFSSFCLISKLKNKTVDDYKSEIVATRLALDNLTAEVGDIRGSRDAFMFGFLEKFCLVVNSKKSEIKRLCDEVDRLREEIFAHQSHVQGDPPPPQPIASTGGRSAKLVNSSSSQSVSVGAPLERVVKVKEEPVAGTSRRSAKASKKETSDAGMSQLLAAHGLELQSQQALDLHLTQQASQSYDGMNSSLPKTRSRRSASVASEDVGGGAIGTLTSSLSSTATTNSSVASAPSCDGGSDKRIAKRSMRNMHYSSSQLEGSLGQASDDDDSMRVSGSRDTQQTTLEALSAPADTTEGVGIVSRQRRKKQIFDDSSDEDESGDEGMEKKKRRNNSLSKKQRHWQEAPIQGDANDVMNYL